MIRLEKVTKRFNQGTPDETEVFSCFDFSVNSGEFVSVIGSNGSGKTTLLNLICGSLFPDSGKIYLNGADITPLPEYKRAKKISRVFQDPKAGTCPHMTILENMALADHKNKRFGLGICVNKKRTAFYRELLSVCGMGLENRMETPVGSLSGGQRQALALVIANMCESELLILDEHTAALDPKSSETIMGLTDRIVREKKITTLMVTHNLNHAMRYGHRLVMFHEGQNVFDRSGEEKEKTSLDEILNIFNGISIEKGC